MVHDFITYVANIPADSYYHALEWLLTGAGLSVLLQVAKHYRQWKGRKLLLNVLRTLLSLITVVGANAGAILNQTVNYGLVGKNALAFSAVVGLVYRISVSPLYKVLVGLVAKARAYDALQNPLPQPTEPLAPLVKAVTSPVSPDITPPASSTNFL